MNGNLLDMKVLLEKETNMLQRMKETSMVVFIE